MQGVFLLAMAFLQESSRVASAQESVPPPSPVAARTQPLSSTVHARTPPLNKERLALLVRQLGDDFFQKREEASALLKQHLDMAVLQCLQQEMDRPNSDPAYDAEIRTRARCIIEMEEAEAIISMACERLLREIKPVQLPPGRRCWVDLVKDDDLNALKDVGIHWSLPAATVSLHYHALAQTRGVQSEEISKWMVHHAAFGDLLRDLQRTALRTHLLRGCDQKEMAKRMQNVSAELRKLADRVADRGEEYCRVNRHPPPAPLLSER